MNEGVIDDLPSTTGTETDDERRQMLGQLHYALAQSIQVSARPPTAGGVGSQRRRQDTAVKALDQSVDALAQLSEKDVNSLRSGPVRLQGVENTAYDEVVPAWKAQPAHTCSCRLPNHL